MKQTENLEQLLTRFTKMIDQVTKKKEGLDPSFDEWLKVDSQLQYLRGCKETDEYQMAFVADQEINMLACLTEIMVECEFK